MLFISQIHRKLTSHNYSAKKTLLVLNKNKWNNLNIIIKIFNFITAWGKMLLSKKNIEIIVL